MAEPDERAEPPKIYLATPPQVELSSLARDLAALFDAAEVACLRLALATRDEDALAAAADIARGVAHERDIPVVIDDHVRMAERLGLDGVHLHDGARRVREMRKTLGGDAIIGAFCGTSRHTAMTAGELGADYVSFGPVSAGTLLGDGEIAEPELFRWWSEMIELPVVAQDGLTDAVLPAIAPFADFLCFGEEVWDDPEGAPQALARKARLLAGFG